MSLFAFTAIICTPLVIILLQPEHADSFVTKSKSIRQYSTNFQFYAQSDPPEGTASSFSLLREEAETLKAEAVKLRSEIEEITEQRQQQNNYSQDSVESLGNDDDERAPLSPWLVTSKDDGEEYRLYVDIGREEGSWMDNRWGMSGNRIELSLDVKLTPNLASQDIAEKMIRDNSIGKSSEVFVLETAQFARLRGGFDRMVCTNGAYRVDVTKKNRYTIRIVIEVEGTIKADQTYVYGDVSIPKGYLYFSLPCFGSLQQLSKKEGLVSVRQIGWHTGWRREESRICGVFRAKTLLEAKRVDPY